MWCVHVVCAASLRLDAGEGSRSHCRVLRPTGHQRKGSHEDQAHVAGHQLLWLLLRPQSCPGSGERAEVGPSRVTWHRVMRVAPHIHHTGHTDPVSGAGSLHIAKGTGPLGRHMRSCTEPTRSAWTAGVFPCLETRGENSVAFTYF